jgi:SAM-dependent methyltransferase
MSEALREEFNRWVTSGRAATLEAHHRAWVEQMLPLMQVHARNRILEIGCGEGWAGRLLATIASEGLVVGLDVSDGMIRNARANSSAHENLLLVWGNAEQIPWQESYFTHALSVESFYYIENPERALREVYRVLEPGGSVWILNHLSKENDLSMRWLEELKIPVRLFSAEEYAEMFARCGFTDFSHRMIPDRAPETRTIYSILKTPEEHRRFRELGALLLSARKSAE